MNRRKLALTRRDFVRATGLAALAAASAPAHARSPIGRAWAAGRDTISVGVIGCGGRGTGAAANALEADPSVRISFFADIFKERIDTCRAALREDYADRIEATDKDCFVGKDAYRRLVSQGVDYVILATPPHFRPKHLAAAIATGKHVFCEKPVAVDPEGIRLVFAAAAEADRRKLSVVAGTQRRHEKSYLDAMNQIRDGRIGRLVSGSCYWNMGELWSIPRTPEMTDMEWQLRNWLYFTWLSGDHIVEQHVHNLDVINWAVGEHPVRCMAVGGRQARTDEQFGHIFDHFAVEYEYPGGFVLNSMCRQTNGCANRVEERLYASEGVARLAPGFAELSGPNPWKFEGDNPNPYQAEHEDLIAAIRNAAPRNELYAVAEATLTAIMGRMSAYTGKEVTWEFALNSKLDLTPPSYDLGPLPPATVAIPGKTELI